MFSEAQQADWNVKKATTMTAQRPSTSGQALETGHEGMIVCGMWKRVWTC